MRKYRGEWQVAYKLLQDWGNWHWVNRDRMPLGFPKQSAFWAVAHGSGGQDFDIPPMTEDQLLCERIVRECPEHMQKLAKLMFCDCPMDGWGVIAARMGVTKNESGIRRDNLLSFVTGALMIRLCSVRKAGHDAKRGLCPRVHEK